jgi:hypothetical protein
MLKHDKIYMNENYDLVRWIRVSTKLNISSNINNNLAYYSGQTSKIYEHFIRLKLRISNLEMEKRRLYMYTHFWAKVGTKINERTINIRTNFAILFLNKHLSICDQRRNKAWLTASGSAIVRSLHSCLRTKKTEYIGTSRTYESTSSKWPQDKMRWWSVNVSTSISWLKAIMY